MAIKLLAVNDVYNIREAKYMVDEENEKDLIPDEDKVQSTRVLVIKGNKEYRMDSASNWVEIAQGGGGVEVESLSVTENGTYTAPEGKAYSPISVSVPNSYAAGDEGKVVSNGALVAQTSDSVTENGTVDTTLINSLTVNVPQGGGGETPEKDVNFIDYDGTILYSYTADEFADLAELPANPSHDGLTAQGWNWTLADAKDHVAEVGELYIGQMYVTASGKTEIDIEIDACRDPYVRIGASGEVTIDWGDDTEPTVFMPSITNLSSTTTKTHHYNNAGNYTIKIDCEEGKAYRLTGSGGSSDYYGGITGASVTNPTSVRRYGSRVTAVRLGKRHDKSIGQGECNNYLNMRYVTIPKHITGTAGANAFNHCNSICALILPPGFKISGNYFAQNAYSLQRLSLPNVPDLFGAGYSFQGCNLKKIIIPINVTSVGSYLTANGEALTRIIIPRNVTSMAAYSLSARPLAEICFQSATPPSATSYSFSIGSDCKIYVPFASLAAYLTASNYPAPVTYIYIGFATYNSGVMLPAQDSTEAYNVVWYVSKDDAIAQTNPITQGNGKEVYCRYTAV